ncbi:MAG: hypothetical protein ACXU71_12960 [Croceibacterium sp.]
MAGVFLWRGHRVVGGWVSRDEDGYRSPGIDAMHLRRRGAGARSIRRTPTERIAVTADYGHDQNIHRFVQMLRVSTQIARRSPSSVKQWPIGPPSA